MTRDAARRLKIVGVSIAVLAVWLAAAPTQGVDLRSQVDPLAQPIVDEGLAVGLVVGIHRDGQSQVLVYGETAKGSGTPPDDRTLYEIGSITKALTGTLLADMQREGLLQVNDPVQSLLPEGVQIPAADQPITLLHLATHTSGLPRLPSNFRPADGRNPYADYSTEQMLEYLVQRPPAEPGKYAYSNYGMGLLGYLLARREGVSYEALLKRRITGPLGMPDTLIELSAEQRSRLAPPYNAELEPASNWDIPTLAGAGGVRSTCGDMFRLIEACLAEDEAAPLAAALHSAQEVRHKEESGLGIGLGWHVARDGITRWHSGMTGGYAAWLSVVRPKRLGVVVLCNTATGEVARLGELVTRVAWGLEVEPPVRRKVVAVDPKVLESYAGIYALTPGFMLTVSVDQGQLMVQATGQQRLPVFAESPTRFFYKAVDAQITFVANDQGRFDQLILHQHGRDMPASRLK